MPRRAMAYELQNDVTDRNVAAVIAANPSHVTTTLSSPASMGDTVLHVTSNVFVLDPVTNIFPTVRIFTESPYGNNDEILNIVSVNIGANTITVFPALSIAHASANTITTVPRWLCHSLSTLNLFGTSSPPAWANQVIPEQKSGQGNELFGGIDLFLPNLRESGRGPNEWNLDLPGNECAYVDVLCHLPPNRIDGTLIENIAYRVMYLLDSKQRGLRGYGGLYNRSINMASTLQCDFIQLADVTTDVSKIALQFKVQYIRVSGK